MSLDPVDPYHSAPVGAETLLAAAATASGHAPARRVFAARDLFRPDRERIDDAVRSAFTLQLRRITHTIASELIAFAGRSLAAAGHPEAALALSEGPDPYDVLTGAALLCDPDLVGELLGRLELDAVADRLAGAAGDDPDRPSLLARLIEHPDRVVAQAARALLAADSRRRDAQEGFPIAHSDLSAERQHRLTWQVAAALRTRLGDTDREAVAAVDTALCEAVRRSLRSYDEGERVEAAAMRLASALDATPADLPDLLLDALADRRLALFVALLARALGSDFAAVRTLALDPDGDRLWVALRALDLPRPAVAQIGFALSEADPHRDLDQFVDRIDPAMAVAPGAARAALSMLRADPAYRDAVAVLADPRGGA